MKKKRHHAFIMPWEMDEKYWMITDRKKDLKRLKYERKRRWDKESERRGGNKRKREWKKREKS